jgi:DNA-binding CsgD family transcriptional regulator
MNARNAEARRPGSEGSEVLDVLASSDTPAMATDLVGHVIFWNRAAERFFGRPSAQVLGRRCYDVLAGRDIFGNRFCHENCCVVAMSRRGEAVQGFELTVGSGAPRQEQTLNVTILKVPGARAESFTLVHILQPIDRASRLTRALERLGASRPGNGHGEDWVPVAPLGPSGAGARTASVAPPLTDREKEILRWVSAGLQNKEIAQKLGISLATVRNHIHNILEKLDVHSKLEAVSLAFRQGWVAGTAASTSASREASLARIQ